MNVLVVSPHPDDEIIGCGGSIIMHVQNGDSVKIIYVTSGGLLSSEGSNTEDRILNREEEACNACRVLGISDFYFMHESERLLVKSQKVLNHAVRLIREFNPSIIYIPHRNESDQV